MLRSRFVFPLLFVASISGCGSSGAGYVPVEGLVTLDGKPLPGVQLTFDQPELGPNANKGYIGRTDAEGRYSLRPMMEEGSGAPPGEYRVSLTTSVADPNAPPPKPPQGARAGSTFYPESAPPPPEKIPRQYAGGKLKFTVPPDGTSEANFDLKSR